MIEPFKYLLQPVAIERNDEGRIVREMPGEVIAVYSREQAVEAIEMFENKLKEIQDAGSGSNGAQDHVRQPVVSGEPTRPG